MASVFYSLSVLSNGSYHFPLQHVLCMVARQVVDLLQQNKSYTVLKEGKYTVPKGSRLTMYVFSSCFDELPSQTVIREPKTEDLLSFHHVKMYGHIVHTVGGLTGQLTASAIPRGAEYGIA